jgi:hypothetical protein
LNLKCDILVPKICFHIQRLYRYVEEALGGRARCTLLACVSPAVVGLALLATLFCSHNTS